MSTSMYTTAQLLAVNEKKFKFDPFLLRIFFRESYPFSSERDRAANNGILAGYNINNLAMVYLRTMITNNQATTESWRYGTRDSAWPTGTGAALNAAATVYADYVSSAGLFNVNSGVIVGYEKRETGRYIYRSGDGQTRCSQ